jgi:hypothetical protein
MLVFTALFVASSAAAIVLNLTAMEAINASLVFAGEKSVVSWVTFSVPYTGSVNVDALDGLSPSEWVVNAGGDAVVALAASLKNFTVFHLVSARAYAADPKINGTVFVVQDNSTCADYSAHEPRSVAQPQWLAPFAEAVIGVSDFVVTNGGDDEATAIFLVARKTGVRQLFFDSVTPARVLPPSCIATRDLVGIFACGGANSGLVRDACSVCGGLSSQCSSSFTSSAMSALFRHEDWWTSINETVANATNVRVAAFSLEGTLILTDPSDADEFTIMPGIRERIQTLHSEGWTIAVFSDETEASCIPAGATTVPPPPGTTGDKPNTATAPASATTASATTATTTAPATSAAPTTVAPGNTTATTAGNTTAAAGNSTTAPVSTTTASVRKRGFVDSADGVGSCAPFDNKLPVLGLGDIVDVAYVQALEFKVDRVRALLGVPLLGAFALRAKYDMRVRGAPLFVQFNKHVIFGNASEVMFVGSRGGVNGDSCVDRNFAAMINASVPVTFMTPREFLLGGTEKFDCSVAPAPAPTPEWTDDTAVTPPPSDSMTTPESKSSPTWIVLSGFIGAAIGAALVGGVCFFVSRRKRSNGYEALLSGE